MRIGRLPPLHSILTDVTTPHTSADLAIFQAFGSWTKVIGTNGRISYTGSYLQVFQDNSNVLQTTSITSSEAIDAYTSFEILCKIYRSEANNNNTMGFVNVGSYIRFMSNSTPLYVVNNAAGGAETSTTLTTNWTVDCKLKAVWTAGQILFYVDGVLKATHTTNVPTVNTMCFYVRAITDAVAPANDVIIYTKGLRLF